MVLRTISGSILGSKSYPKVDQKINQILDRFLMDFGSHVGPILTQFWVQKSIKNQGRFLYEKGDGRGDQNVRVQGTKNSQGRALKITEHR